MSKVLALIIIAAAAFGQSCPDTMWSRSFGLASEEWAWSVAECANGDMMVGGLTAVAQSPGDDYHVLQRISPSGNLLWSRTYENILLDVNGSFLLPMGNDEFVLAGTAKLPDGNDDISLLKVNGQGDTIWTHLAGVDSNGYLTGIKATSDGGFIAAGFLDNSGGPISFLAKLDDLGHLVWQHPYPEPAGRWGTLFLDVAAAENSTYIAVGATWISDTLQICIVRTNATGDTLWTRVHQLGDLAQINAIIPLPSDEFMLMGIHGQAFVDGCLFLSRSTTNGDLAWIHTYACGQVTPSCNFLRLPDDRYLLHGTCFHDSGASADFDALMIVTDQSGNEQFQCRYGDSGYQSAEGAVVTHDGSIVLAGSDTTSTGDENIYVLRTEAILAANNAPPLVPQSIRLLGNYPNPFNASTEIRFELNRAMSVSLKVYDILGRETATLVDGMQEAGSHAVTWNAQAASSGVYFAVLQSGDVHQVRKMMLLK